MGMTLSPMAGMGSNGGGMGAGASLSMPMLMQMLQGANQPSATPATPLQGLIPHTPPVAGATPGPAMMPSAQQPQQNNVSAMLPSIMQMLSHTAAGQNGGTQGNGPGGLGLLGFLTGNQSGVVPQGVPGGMPTSAPGTTATTGGIGGYLTLPGILRALNPNYAGPMPGSGAF